MSDELDRAIDDVVEITKQHGSLEGTVTTYVAYLHPGSFFSEESVSKVPNRDPNQQTKDAPQSAFAFFYYDIVTSVVDVEGERIETASTRRNISKTYYVDAELLDYAAVEALANEEGISPTSHRILLSNMHGNGYDLVVRCRTGNFQPYEPDKQELVSSS